MDRLGLSFLISISDFSISPPGLLLANWLTLSAFLLWDQSVAPLDHLIPFVVMAHA